MKPKKQKLLIVFAALLCTAVFCAGCAKDGTDRSAGAAPAGAQVTADGFALSAGARMITDVDGLMGNPVAGTENGRYQVLPREDGSENIIYIDYATRSCIYLCNRPECRHGDASCPAWLSAEDCAGGAGFFTDGETLYLQRLGAGSDPGSPGSATETSASQIIRMDLNGDNRELLYRLEGAACIAGSIVKDGHILYFLQDHVESAQDEVQVIRQLVALDTVQKAVTPLVTVNTDYYLLGVCDAGFLLKTLEVQEDDFTTRSTIYLYRTRTGGIEPIKQWTADNIITRVCKNKIYMIDPGKAALLEIDPETKEETVLAKDLPLNADDTVRPEGIYDGHFCFYIFEHGVRSVDTKREYAVELQTGSFLERTLEYFTADGIRRAVSLMAETPDAFFVDYGAEWVTVQSTNPDGSAFSFEAERRLVGLIAKEDYWNNIPNYQPVEIPENMLLY